MRKREESEPIRALARNYVVTRDDATLNELARFLKERLRSATLTYQQILDKTKLTLVATLRLYPALFEVDAEGRRVKVLPQAH